MDIESTTELWLSTEGSFNVSGAESTPLRHPSAMPAAIKAVYVLGIVGNAAALVILRRCEKKRNRKHLLLMTSLAANDLVALVGMLALLLAGERWAAAARAPAYCAARVALRVFGVGSVCIAVTMALERYLALTRPFLYQKVTYYVIRTALLASWGGAALLTCAPVLGLGLYYDAAAAGGAGACARYRDATTDQPVQWAYAVVYVGFGTLLCGVLVYCNLAVIGALYAHGAAAGRPVRRVSSGRHGGGAAPDRPRAGRGSATHEEVAFSRLMAALSVLFMICWLPQMLTSALYLARPVAARPRLALLARLSDALMLLNYVLDPFLYVLMRRSGSSWHSLTRALAGCFKRHKGGSGSPRASCCAPETVLVSDSGELRPLRPAAPPAPAPAPRAPAPPRAAADILRTVKTIKE